MNENERDSKLHRELKSLPLRRAPETLLKGVLAVVAAGETNASSRSHSLLKRRPVFVAGAIAAAAFAAGVFLLAPFIPIGSPDHSAGRPAFEPMPEPGRAQNIVQQSLRLPAGAAAAQRVSVAQALSSQIGRALGLGNPSAAIQPPPIKSGRTPLMDLAALKARAGLHFNQAASARFPGGTSGASYYLPGGMPAAPSARSAQAPQALLAAKATAGARALASAASPSSKSGSAGGTPTQTYGVANEGVGGAAAPGSLFGTEASANVSAAGGAGAQNGAPDANPPANPSLSGGSNASQAQSSSNVIAIPSGALTCKDIIAAYQSSPNKPLKPSVNLGFSCLPDGAYWPPLPYSFNTVSCSSPRLYYLLGQPDSPPATAFDMTLAGWCVNNQGQAMDFGQVMATLTSLGTGQSWSSGDTGASTTLRIYTEALCPTNMSPGACQLKSMPAGQYILTVSFLSPCGPTADSPEIWAQSAYFGADYFLLRSGASPTPARAH